MCDHKYSEPVTIAVNDRVVQQQCTKCGVLNYWTHPCNHNWKPPIKTMNSIITEQPDGTKISEVKETFIYECIKCGVINKI